MTHSDAVTVSLTSQQSRRVDCHYVLDLRVVVLSIDIIKKNFINKRFSN